MMIGTSGRLALAGVRIARCDSAGTDTLVRADLLLVSGGINPAVQLASQSRTPVEWSEGLASWVPGVPVLPQFSAGSAHGVTGLAAPQTQKGLLHDVLRVLGPVQHLHGKPMGLWGECPHQFRGTRRMAGAGLVPQRPVTASRATRRAKLQRTHQATAPLAYKSRR